MTMKERLELFKAIILRDLGAIRTMLSGGVDLNAKNTCGNTSLHDAISRKRNEIVKCFIEAGADVNIRNQDDQTALELVYSLDYSKLCEIYPVIKMLVEAGSDVNTTGKLGITALHYATMNGDINFVQYLIKKGADVNAKDFNHNWTPLHYAAFYVTSEDPSLFEILLSAKADPNARGKKLKNTSYDNETPLHLLSRLQNLKISLVKIVEVFLKYGADLDLVDQFESTPIDNAIKYSNLKVTEAYMVCGKMTANSQFLPYHSTNAIVKDTVFHGACLYSTWAMIDFLLKRGANINQLNNSNASPLMHLIASVMYIHKNRDKKGFDIMERIKMLKYFLFLEPDINHLPNGGRNILTYRIRDCPEIPDILWQTIVQHIAKLKSINSPIVDSLRETIFKNNAYKKYFDKCHLELRIAKKHKLYANSKVTYFNLLVDDLQSMLKYAENPDLVKAFNMEQNVIQRFPIYGPRILERFLNIIENKKLNYKNTKVVSEIMPISVQPKHKAIINLLRFLNDENVVNFRKVKL